MAGYLFVKWLFYIKAASIIIIAIGSMMSSGWFLCLNKKSDFSVVMPTTLNILAIPWTPLFFGLTRTVNQPKHLIISSGPKLIPKKAIFFLLPVIRDEQRGF